jgi:hypothetical protein
MPAPQLPTRDEIAELLLFALVAFAARCARRVEPLVLASSLNLRHKEPISKAINSVQSFWEVIDLAAAHDVAVAFAATVTASAARAAQDVLAGVAAAVGNPANAVTPGGVGSKQSQRGRGSKNCRGLGSFILLLRRYAKVWKAAQTRWHME